MGSAFDLRIIPLILFVFYQAPPAQSCGIQDIALKFLWLYQGNGKIGYKFITTIKISREEKGKDEFS